MSCANLWHMGYGPLSFFQNPKLYEILHMNLKWVLKNCKRQICRCTSSELHHRSLVIVLLFISSPLTLNSAVISTLHVHNAWGSWYLSVVMNYVLDTKQNVLLLKRSAMLYVSGHTKEIWIVPWNWNMLVDIYETKNCQWYIVYCIASKKVTQWLWNQTKALLGTILYTSSLSKLRHWLP